MYYSDYILLINGGYSWHNLTPLISYLFLNLVSRIIYLFIFFKIVYLILNVSAIVEKKYKVYV